MAKKLKYLIWKLLNWMSDQVSIPYSKGQVLVTVLRLCRRLRGGRKEDKHSATWAASACPKGDFTCAALFLSRSSEVQEHISEKSLSKAVEAWLHKVDWLAV